MNCNIGDIVLYAISYAIFLVIESLAINGWHEACRGSCVQDLHKGKVCSGNIIYKLNPSFFEKNRGKTWFLPLFGCVRCESSAIGGLIFWPTVLFLFGFHFFEIFLYILNTCALTTLNYWVYKRL